MLAPIPSAKTSAATAVKPRWRISRRKGYRMSGKRDLMGEKTRKEPALFRFVGFAWFVGFVRFKTAFTSRCPRNPTNLSNLTNPTNPTNPTMSVMLFRGGQMSRLWIASLVCVVALYSGAGAPLAQGGRQGGDAQGPPRGQRPASIADRTAGMQKLDGFFPMYWDEPTGVLYLEIPKLNTEVLYQTGISAGMGSNDIGLDRGLLVGTRVVSFERVGPKVLMVQPNYDY